MAKEFHYSGEELNGTWQVIEQDLRGVKNINSPEVKDFFKSTNDSINVMFLPVGQKVNFWLTGSSHGYSPFDRLRTGMDIGMKLIFPINPRMCEMSAWDYLCDKNKKVNINNQNGIKDNAYIVTNPDEGLLNHVFPTARELAYVKELWPDVKNYYYNLNMNGETSSYDIYPMKNNNEILFYATWDGGNRFGVLLKRTK
jgi:hypothetical protein